MREAARVTKQAAVIECGKIAAAMRGGELVAIFPMHAFVRVRARSL